MSEKKPLSKGCILCESIYITFFEQGVKGATEREREREREVRLTRSKAQTHEP